jgi:RNA polymerase sigma-70 factor (ECF subfamily)
MIECAGGISGLAIDIKECYEKYMPMVLRRCRKMLRSEEDAVDAAQDVFVKLLRGEEKLSGRFPSSLLYTIATNVCLNKIRWKKRHAETSRDVTEDAVFSVNGGAYSEVEAKMIMDAIFENEPEETRLICYMYHADGMTLKEIGEAVGMSFSGVSKRLKAFASRARIRYGEDTGGSV